MAKIDLMKVTCVYGRTYYVSVRDFNSNRKFLPLYTSAGTHYLNLPKNHPLKKGQATTMLRENIAEAIPAN